MRTRFERYDRPGGRSLEYKTRVRNRDRDNAGRRARHAISRGIIAKSEHCKDCREVKPLQAHHEDYSKPFDVEFLCNPCHELRHKRLGWR